jgi:hypothetical protein
LYGKSPNGSVVAQPGSESAGLYGNGTTFGGYYFEWFVFQTSATQPATPTGGSWNFQTDSGTAPSGWTNAPASNPTNPVWISIALVNSRSTSPLVWSTPGVLSYSGTINGSGAPTSGVGQIGELYIQTGVTPNALWFKSGSTTWTQITGSALYVDLTSSQTIAGTKTFSSTIQGNISGNAGTVTNGVYTNGTYVDPSWIASLAGSKITGNISGNAANVTGTVAIVNGGTGATTASGARTNLGLGTIATQDASSVAITGGSIAGIIDLAIADGGTGASTAGQARINLGLGTAAVLDAGVANGVATLDAGGTVPLSQIPASIQGGVSYQGAWNASTNTPTLTSSVGTKGYYYVVSVAGSTNLNGVTSWNIGDWAIFNGTAWEKIDNTDAVTSVNGYTGTVVLTYTDVGAASAAQGALADSAVQTITSSDGSIVVIPSGTTIDLAVSAASPASTLLAAVRNTTGATLTKGTAVYISGATGQISTVSKALATSDATSAQTLGLITSNLANNSNGYVTVIGLVANINTSAYTDGQQLYLSPTTAGTLTATKPYAPQHLVYVAIVEYAHPTHGKLFVKVQNGYEMDELHNVSAQSPTTGQTLVYNASTLLWEKSFAPIISGTTINGTVIGGTTPAAGTFTTLTSTGQANLGGVAGSESLIVNAIAGSTRWIEIAGSVSGNTSIRTRGAGNPSFQLVNRGTGPITFSTADTLSNIQAQVSNTASAVNYVQVTGAATGASPTISAQGSDSVISFALRTKGTGSNITPQFDGSTYFQNLSAQNQFRVFNTASAVNYLQTGGSVAGSGLAIQAAGSDTNIPLVLQPKGTGALQAQQTDSTATGGNARGANAVDWQTFTRSSAAQVASGLASSILGGARNTSSSIASVVVGGTDNTASANSSFIGAGNGNIASGTSGGIVSGINNTNSGIFAFIGAGQANTNAGYLGVVVGGAVNSGTSGSAVTTQSGTMNGTTAVTLSGSNANIKVGQLIQGTSIVSASGITPYTYVAAISGTSLTLSQAASGSSTSTLSFYTPHGVVVGGGNNQATGSYSFIGGGGDAGTAANRNVASGDWSVVGGGRANVASGVGAVVVGGGYDGALGANTASGAVSFIGGGRANTASSFGSSVIGGYSNTSNGTGSSIYGGDYGTTRSINGITTTSASETPFGTYVTGQSQTSILVLGRQTTDATPTVLRSDPSSAGTTNQVILPNNSAYAFKGTVIANVTGAANGAAWSFEGAIMRGANAASTVLIGTPAINRVAATAGATAWVIALTADTTNGGLAVTVTGAASTTIRWVCRAETCEVTF